MLRARVLTVLAILPLLLGALLWLPQLYWEALTLIIALGGLYEWSRLAGFTAASNKGYLSVSLALCAVLWLALHREAIGPAVATGALLAASCFWLALAPWWLKGGRPRPERITLAAMGWVVLLPTWIACVELRRLDAKLLLFILLAIWIADTAAYFVGRAYGKRKLAPHISPGKTWEGVIGALGANTLYGLALAYFYQVSLTTGILLLLGLWALTYLGIVGDLFESWIKRGAAVKDSGHILPGHGGILDRIDSVTAVTPVAGAYLLMFCSLA